MEDIIQSFEAMDNQISGIIDNLNESRYDNAHMEDSETETSETNHIDMDRDTL